MDLHKRERTLGESGERWGAHEQWKRALVLWSGSEITLHVYEQAEAEGMWGGDRLRPNKRLEVNPLKMYILLKILDILLL